MSASPRLRFNARRVAVIGAGPSGLAALKYLRAENKFEKIVAFEQRSAPGGIWNYTAEDRDDGSFAVPKTRPSSKDLDQPIWIGKNVNGVGKGKANAATNGTVNGASKEDKEVQFLSPIYDRLETNIPRMLMRFQDHAFPDDIQLFPKHASVKEYLKGYAEDVLETIRFRTQVVDVRFIGSKAEQIGDEEVKEESWSVTTKNIVTGEQTEEVFDAVVVANGHYYTPYIPDIEGIKEWYQTSPKSISHSKFYRTPDVFKDKKVIVVGNSASGLDIGAQLSGVVQQPLIASIKTESYMSPGPAKDRKEYPPITHLDVNTRTATFADGGKESDIDAIIFCTGYFYSLPFISDVDGPPLITEGNRVDNTYQHVFYAPHPTLSTLVLNQRVIPFPVAEAQAAILARVYAGRLALPPLAEMEQWEQETLKENGPGTDFHTLAFPKDAIFINELHDWAAMAEREEEGVGKTPPKWTEWHFWCRERFPQIKKAFNERGEERANVRTLEELGFDFEAWKVERAKQEEKLL
ncbi:uncharacterized protein K452DRAFT_319672 [Aplosporella prunicola CBS 121167]|uniref:FAD/NAD(P)-binding domain-containing protein n=1 Tax=Aplosporella prunicola CBS 121167 TaxID=1176127 RepID=A0A6A6B9X5_9PEZI|nr:uncharacterized protein K452DRAFT_319672 [Aplosporella prunicola CBS 121167]KAF2140115.1 hypothetical protein K452DRAFT_319672 [Aplosporella prunicola CBS 121167]